MGFGTEFIINVQAGESRALFFVMFLLLLWQRKSRISIWKRRLQTKLIFLKTFIFFLFVDILCLSTVVFTMNSGIEN